MTAVIAGIGPRVQRRCRRAGMLTAIAGLLLATVVLTLPATVGRADFIGHGGPVKGVAVSPDGRQALTASFDYTAILWDLPSRSERRVLRGHDAAVNAVAFVATGPGQTAGDRTATVAVSGSDDGTAILWDLETGTIRHRLAGHGDKVVAVAASADGRRVATAGWDRTARLWDAQTGGAIGAPLRHPAQVNAVAFTPDGHHLLTGDHGGALSLWRVADGTRLARLSRHDQAITAIAVSADGRRAVTASTDASVRLWAIEPSAEIREDRQIHAHDAAVFAVAMGPEGRLVASGGLDGAVIVWDLAGDVPLPVPIDQGTPVWALAFGAEGRVLLSAGIDSAVRAWLVADGVALTRALAAPPSFQSDQMALAARAFPYGYDQYEACGICHSLTPGSGRHAGPTLYGLFGRRIGAVADYAYSPALADGDIVWTAETVAQLFTVGPHVMTPGTKMPLQRMPDPEKRRALIDFLLVATAPPGTGIPSTVRGTPAVSVNPAGTHPAGSTPTDTDPTVD